MNQLKAGAVLSYVTIATNILIGLAYTPFMLRMLGQVEYGLYSLAASVVAYLTVLDLGFGHAIVRYTAKYRAEDKKEEQYKLFGMFLRLYSVVGLLALLGGLCLFFNVESMFGNTMNADELYKMRIIMMLMIINVAVTFPLSVFGAIITAYENFIFQKVVNIVRIIANPIVVIVFLLLGYKAITMVVISTLFNLATLLVNAFFCFRRLKVRFIFGSFDMKFMKEVSIYSFWIFLNIIMDRIYWSTGQFILGIYRGAEVVAIYAIAIQLKTMFYLFSTSITEVFLPKVTAMVTKGVSDREISNLFIKTGRIQFGIILFILLGFILFGKAFIVLWAGSDYADAYPITLLLFIASLIPLIQNIGITILQAQNKMEFRSLLYLVISVSSIFLAVPLAQAYGGIGCAIATSIALFLGQGLIMNIYYQKVIKIEIVRFWKEIIRMSVVPVVFTVLMYYVLQRIELDSFISLIGMILIYSLLFIPLFWFFSLNAYEHSLIKEPLNKFLLRKRI